jgi:hypothetical protein
LNILFEKQCLKLISPVRIKMTDDEQFLDNFDTDDNKSSRNDDVELAEIAAQKDKELAERNKIARKRIDELKEQKRLKDLLDDEEDW